MKRLMLALLGLFFAQNAFSANVTEMSQQQLLTQDKGSEILILDVRTPAEFAEGHVPGAVNISHNQLEKRLSEILSKKDKPVVVYCRSGVRAAKALKVLEQHDFSKLYHLTGDMLGWQEAKLKTEK